MLTKSIVTLVILAIFTVMTIQANDEIQLYSQAGYPYKNLISKTKSVNILFTEKEDNISCRVRVSLGAEQKHNTKTLTSQKVLISKQAFEEKPLVSCLPRVEAKRLLTFAYL